MITRINVTQRDIERAAKYAAHPEKYPRDKFCPIALAAKRAFKDSFLSVGPFSIWLWDVRCPLPPEAAAFIDVFDNAVSSYLQELPLPGPIKFNLEYPDDQV